MNNNIAVDTKLNQIHHLGSFVIDEQRTYNSYLVKSEGLEILIDIPPFQVFSQFIGEISKVVQVNQITHLVIQYISLNIVNSLNELINLGFKGKIITNRYYGQQMNSLKLPVEIEFVSDLKYKLTAQKQTVLKFIPMVFLPDPEMFMTYMPSNQALFSSTIFSSFRDTDQYPSIENFKKAIFSFHKLMLLEYVPH